MIGLSTKDYNKYFKSNTELVLCWVMFGLPLPEGEGSKDARILCSRIWVN
jgi:hypothetical protein